MSRMFFAVEVDEFGRDDFEKVLKHAIHFAKDQLIEKELVSFRYRIGEGEMN
jgi:hypothetical protein